MKAPKTIFSATVALAMSAGALAAQPRAASVHWFKTIESAPNSTEVLFYAMQLCVHNEGTIHQLEAWARSVTKERKAAIDEGRDWQPSPAWGKNNGVSKLFEPMAAAFKGVRGKEDLGKIAAAMKIWDGDGRHDELNALALSHYCHRDLRAVRKIKAKKAGHPSGGSRGEPSLPCRA